MYIYVVRVAYVFLYTGNMLNISCTHVSRMSFEYVFLYFYFQAHIYLKQMKKTFN
jgi:hypothetical protein